MLGSRWLTNVRKAKDRAQEEVQIAGYWATWAISQLAEPLRSKAAELWAEGKLPSALPPGMFDGECNEDT